LKSKGVAEVIDLMMSENIEAIIYGAKSDISILNYTAVKFGTKYRITAPEYINQLRILKDNHTEHFGVPISKMAVAALDVLEVEKYSGDDSLIIRLIDSAFDFSAFKFG